MRKSVVVAVALLLLCTVAAFADTIDRVSPQSFFAGNPEQFLTIYGSGLAGAESTSVVYSGQIGQFTVLASNATSTQIDAWVPIEVTATPGRYSIDVYANDGGGVVRHIGPAVIDVVTLVIQEPPLLGVPEAVIEEATSASGANVSYDIKAVSQGGTGLTVNCDHASGALFPLNATTVTCTATDSIGSTTASFEVFVGDTVAPIISVPAPISSADPVVTFTVTANDAIDGATPVICSPSSGSTFPIGVTHVQCTSQDLHANIGYASFPVTVTGGLPVLHLPADITVEATQPAGAVVTYTATADNGTIQCTPPSGSTFVLGTTTVTCIATNSSGSVTGAFKVTVVDTTPPQILRLKPNPEILWPPDHRMVPVTIDAVVVDDVDLTPFVHIIDVKSNQPVNGTGDGDTAPDWEITGPLTLNLRGERAANADRTYTITVQAIDASGNKTQSTVEVKVTQVRGRAAR